MNMSPEPHALAYSREGAVVIKSSGEAAGLSRGNLDAAAVSCRLIERYKAIWGVNHRKRMLFGSDQFKRSRLGMVVKGRR